MSHFEISEKLRKYFYPYRPTAREQNFWALFSDVFSFFLPRKLISRKEDMQIIKKRFFYFGLRIPLPIQIQLLDIENPKKSKTRLHLMHCTIQYINSLRL
jgi:hypothetical protein